jgi:hypothetical protein
MMAELQIGKYYKWIGPKDFDDNWTSEMNAIKDGNPHKCTSPRTFEGVKGDWNWTHVYKYLEEVGKIELKVGDRVKINNSCSGGSYHWGKVGVIQRLGSGNSYFIHYDDSKDETNHELNCLELLEEKKMSDIPPQVGDTVRISGIMGNSKHHLGDCGIVVQVAASYAVVKVNGEIGNYLWQEMEIVKRKEEHTQDEEVKIELKSLKAIRQSVVSTIEKSLKEE